MINVFELTLHVYFTGTAGDSLSYNNGMKFTTQDVDNDLKKGAHCAQERHGAWWFRECSYAHLNGAYLPGSHDKKWEGICWKDFKGGYYSYKATEMKVGPDKV
ncbi:fibrinogen C domain-containing 1-like [Paramuricea clavata]|uniref:Fibrinogen C domain-containing 1-like n=1 Tax=Paramuricea clavata TaxID=317549 RepID=A0A6S7IC64_PARCT|nr:fibrinogen C domain-containing 1-like [Paramuricea clavata]